jgi:hypothetical protein
VFYMSAVGYKPRNVFKAAHRACEEHGITLVILDSYGVALAGDAEAAKDVIAFNNEMLEPFRALGAAVLVIDHQSKHQIGQSYQQKGAFGSVYKSILARSVIQAEATERGEGTLTVRLRQKKHSFGPLADPFAVRFCFSRDAVTLEAAELEATEKAEEATLNAVDRVKHALEAGPAYPSEISEVTTLAVKTVKNALTVLCKQGLVEPTGEKEGRTERVQLIVPASLPYKGDGDDAPTLTVEEVAAEIRRSGSGPARALATYLAKPNAERLGWLTCAVLRVRGLDITDWESHAPVVEEAAGDIHNHPLDCDCEGCI